MAADGRPRTIQEHRGIKPTPRDRTRKYTANSYAAQYGITVEDAEDLVSSCNDHQQVERAIFALFRRDAELKRRAILKGQRNTPELSDGERKRFERAGVDVAGMVAGSAAQKEDG